MLAPWRRITALLPQTRLAVYPSRPCASSQSPARQLKFAVRVSQEGVWRNDHGPPLWPIPVPREQAQRKHLTGKDPWPLSRIADKQHSTDVANQKTHRGIAIEACKALKCAIRFRPRRYRSSGSLSIHTSSRDMSS